MDNSRFSIFAAVKSAYSFVSREWLYLLKAGCVPLLMQIGTSIFLQFVRPDASNLEAYLWSLPATVLLSWFMFVEVRLLLLGERLDRLSSDTDFLRDRQHAMRAAVMTATLFNMGISAGVMTLMALAASNATSFSPAGIAELLLIGAIIWMIRLGVLPILAAVHYPFRPFLHRTGGPLFPLRLIGMGIVVLFPLAFVFQLFIAAVIGKMPQDNAAVKLSDMQELALAMGGAPLTLIISALLNAAAAYALKQILGTRSDGVTV